MPARLSICLPTHDGRAARLDEALESVFAQVEADGLGERVQVCVSDNGARDATQAVLERHRARGRALTTHRFDANRGFTANLVAVAALADGDALWFLSSDDGAAPGGVAALLATLDAHPDVPVVSLRPVSYDLSLAHELGPWTPVIHPPEPERRQVVEGFPEAVGRAGLLVGLLSSLVVRRDAWAAAVTRVGPAELARFPYHPHTRIALEALRERPRWLWEPARVLKVRTGEPNSMLASLAGDVPAYHLRTTREVEELFATMVGRRSAAYRRLLGRAFWFGWNPGLVVSWKAAGMPPATDRELLVAMSRWFWWLPGFYLVLPVLLVPARLVPARTFAVGAALTARLRRAGVLRAPGA